MPALSKIAKATKDWVTDSTWYRGSKSKEEISPFTNVTQDMNTAMKYATEDGINFGKDSNISKLKLKIEHDEIFDLKNPDHFNVAKEEGLFDDLADDIEANDLVEMNLPEDHPLEYSSDFEILENHEESLKKLGFKGFFDWGESGVRVFDPESIETLSIKKLFGEKFR